MRIINVESKTVAEGDRQARWLVLHADSGLSGAGEVEPTASSSAERLTALTDLLVGRDPFDNEALLADAKSDADGTIADIALVSAASAAMLDLARQGLDIPAHQLMGGAMWHRIRACAIGWEGGASTVEGIVAAAQRTVVAGYTALRLTPFRLQRTHPAGDLDAAVELVRAVRAAVPDEVDLVIAAERRLNVASALEFAASLREIEPMWIEEPAAAWPVQPIREVSERTNVPLVAGRGAAPEILRALVDGNIVAHLVVDVARVGGPLEARRIAALAEIYHIGIVPTASGGSLSVRDTLQFAAVLPNLSLVEVRPGTVDLNDGMIAVCSGDQQTVKTEEVMS